MEKKMISDVMKHLNGLRMQKYSKEWKSKHGKKMARARWNKN